LIGRAPIQERLSRALTEVESGRFVTVVLRGPSGIGKTRLVEWLSSEARGRGFAVLRGRARAHERVPYNALDGAIDDLARLWLNVPQMGSRVANLRRVAASAFPVFAEGPATGGAATRTAAFAALAALLGQAARSSMVVVALDDLQWADADSLSLLESLVAARPAGVLVMGTLRDEPEYAGATVRLATLRGLEIVDLPALSDDALAEVIAGAARRRGRAVRTEEVTPACGSERRTTLP
jgi:predicted ATPase